MNARMLLINYWLVPENARNIGNIPDYLYLLGTDQEAWIYDSVLKER